MFSKVLFGFFVTSYMLLISVVFLDVPYKYKSGMDCEVEFHITSLEKFNTLFVIKHFFMSPSEATDIEDYTYISLTHAAETLAQSCNFYGVVDKILKVRLN